MVPVCAAHAFSIDEIMLHAEQKSWYAGKNLQAGDFFTYGICDGTAVARTDCYTVRMDFYALMESGNRNIWMVQAEIHDGDQTTPHILAVDASSLDIKTIDFVAEPYADSIERTVFFIGEFASEHSPGQLSIGSTWGELASLDPNSELTVMSRGYYSIPAGKDDIDVYLVQHTLFDTSSFAIHRDIPLPVSGILYDPYWPLPEPRVLFVFELVDTNL